MFSASPSAYILRVRGGRHIVRWLGIWLVGLGLTAGLWVTFHELAQPRNLRVVSYVGSAECRRCHRDHDASWRRTFHRTMTQAASAERAAGDFDGKSLMYFGVRAAMEKDATGQLVVRYGGEGFSERRFVVDKMIGSRRYQQYVGRLGNELVRLPVAWDIEQGRWFHMNGAFLTPDPEPTATGLSQADFERHLTRWNDNCVFCHNVAPNPGKRQGAHADRFETEVAELGIACEACHGPGAEHARRNQNPLRRYALYAREQHDPTIVNPKKLSKDRASDICGRCHGQRITDDLDAFLRRGDPFIPGEDLALYSAPLWRDTTLRETHGVFEARFWADGTPRLTAYEYQGMLQAACARNGSLTCIDCHAMHGGDPRGQLRPDRTGASLCTSCHQALAPLAAQRAHAHHPANALPSCLDCHMPRIVYGVLAAHRTHRIETPDPARAAELDRPDACTSCHVDRTRRWAAAARARLWRKPGAPLPEDSAWSEAQTQLFAGDPIERALAAHAFSAAAQGPSQRDSQRPTVVAMLMDVMEHDPYPAVRRFAWRALRVHVPNEPSLAQFVPESTPAQRSSFLRSLRERLHVAPLDPSLTEPLRQSAREQAIDIGE